MAGKDALRRPLLAAGLMGLTLAGCYTLQPAVGVDPRPGTKMAFEINDAGRVALGGQMGPEIAQVEGTLVQKDNDGYLLAVSNVRTIRGGEQAWTGEQVHLSSQYLGPAQIKKFSAGRSIGLGVVTIGGFAAILASRSLLGIGQDDGPGHTDTLNTRLGRP